MGNSFLEPAYQGMSGMLRSLVTSSLDRTNEAVLFVNTFLVPSTHFSIRHIAWTAQLYLVETSVYELRLSGRKSKHL